MTTSRFFSRPIVILSLALITSGCAQQYVHPNSIVLQTPPPEKALVYFLRIPHDGITLSISSDGKRIAKLPPETYVGIPLPPGTYRFVTSSWGLLGGEQELMPPLEATLKPNDRLFFHVSGRGDSGIALGGIMSVKGAGAIPLFQKKEYLTNHEWKACSELDARGLMTITRQILPES
ncbi:MAG: hypothetical protein HYU78_13895 [Rhodocyclales bacterium]|nr:hypothetical protein [Rhodocyclales bacterium]